MIATYRRALPPILFALVLSVGGCAKSSNVAADDARPSVVPTSAAPSPSQPPLAGQRSERGAAEFVRYWFRTLDYASRTGDTVQLVAGSDPACTACQSAISTIDNAYNDGGSLRGGTFTLQDVVVGQFSAGDRPTIEVTFDRTPRSSLSPVGDVRGSLPAASFVQAQVLLGWTGESWRTRAVLSDTPLA